MRKKNQHGILTQLTEEEYQTIFMMNPDPISISTLDGTYIDINQKFTTVLGFTRKDVIGKSVRDLNIWMNKNDRDKWTTLLRKEKTINNFESKFRCKDGSIKTALLAATIIFIDKKPHILTISKDISKIKTIEQKILESEEKYLALFKSTPDAVAISKFDSGYVDVNDAYQNITGYSRKDIIGKLSSDIKIWVNPKDRELLIKQLKSKGFINNMESEFRCKDGSIRIGLLSAKIIKLQNKKYIFTITRDITKRKKIEKALRESEERFRSIYENAAIGIYRTTPNGEILLANPTVVKMLGFSSFDEIKNANLTADSFVIPKERIKFIRAMKKNGIVSGFESQWIKKDGKKIYVRETARTIYNKNGEIKYFDGTVENISEYKKNKEELIKLSTAAKQSPSTMVITNLAGDIEYANPKFVEITGYQNSEFIGKNPRILKSGEHSNSFYENLWATISNGNIWKGEFHNKKKDGSFFWESATISPIFDKKGKIINYLKIAEDITEKKHLKLLQEISFNIANAINRTENLQTLLFFIKKELSQIIDTKNYFVALYNEKTDRISLPFDLDEKDNFESFPSGKTFTAYVIKTGKPLFAPLDVQMRLIKEGKVELIGTQPKIWIGIPLIVSNKTIGVLAVQNYDNPNIYTKKDVEFLTFISEEIALAIKQKKANEQIKKDLREKNILVKELYHRTKNNMQVISSMLRMTSANSKNKFVHETFRNIITKINTMALVHQKLYESNDLSQINLKDYIIDVIKLISQSYMTDGNNILLTYNLDNVFVLFDTALPLGLILDELVTNIFKYAFPNNKKGQISIRLYKNESDEINIFVEDDGIGILDNINLRNSKTMGLQNVFFFVDYQLKGKISYKINNGLKWHITFKDNLNNRRI